MNQANKLMVDDTWALVCERMAQEFVSLHTLRTSEIGEVRRIRVNPGRNRTCTSDRPSS